MMVQCSRVSWPDSLPCVWVWLTTGARRWRASPARPCCRSWPPPDQYRKYFPANKPRIQAAVGSKNFIIWLYQQYQHPHTLQMSRDRTINIITCYQLSPDGTLSIHQRGPHTHHHQPPATLDSADKLCILSPKRRVLSQLPQKKIPKMTKILAHFVS